MSFLRSSFGKPVVDAPPAETLDGPPVDPAVMEATLTTLRAFWSDVQRLVVLTEQHGYLPSHRREIYRALLRDFFVHEEIGNAREETCRRHVSQPSSSFYPIIQRGVPAFRQWHEHRELFDAADFRSLMSAPPFKSA
jgi:hypothetical protein